MDVVTVLVHLLTAGILAVKSQLTCSSRRFSNGSVHYQLSQEPSSSSCKTCWEDQNKTVIARDKSFYPNLVQSLRNDSITLAGCRDLHYILECSGVLQEIDCPGNCSHPADPSHPANSTSPDNWVIMITVTTAAATAFVILAVLWCRHKKKCSSYTQTPQIV